MNNENLKRLVALSGITLTESLDDNMLEPIKAAIRAQLAKPTRAVVNSESAFVTNRLNREGYEEAARIYWSWVCGAKNKITDPEIIELQQQLDAIDKKSSPMPAWGYSGT